MSPRAIALNEYADRSSGSSAGNDRTRPPHQARTNKGSLASPANGRNLLPSPRRALHRHQAGIIRAPIVPAPDTGADLKSP